MHTIVNCPTLQLFKEENNLLGKIQERLYKEKAFDRRR
jgi:hypothetical protein